MLWWVGAALASVGAVPVLASTVGNDSDGALEDWPISEILVRLLEHEGGTRMEMRMTFETREDMERIVELGTVEGMKGAVGQMDGLLAG